MEEGLQWVALISSFQVCPETPGFRILGGNLMGRTLGFFFRFQPGQLLPIVWHSKISQRFQW